MYGIIQAYDNDDCCTWAEYCIFKVTKDLKDTLRARLETVEAISKLTPKPDIMFLYDSAFAEFFTDSLADEYPEVADFLDSVLGKDRALNERNSETILIKDSKVPEVLKQICDGEHVEGFDPIRIDLKQKWYTYHPDLPVWQGYVNDSNIEVWTDDIPVKEILGLCLLT